MGDDEKPVISEFEDLTEEDARRYVERVEGLSEKDIPTVMAGYAAYIKAKTEMGDACDAYGIVIHLEDYMPEVVVIMKTRTYDPEERREQLAEQERQRRKRAKDAAKAAFEQMKLARAED